MRFAHIRRLAAFVCCLLTFGLAVAESPQNNPAENHDEQRSPDPRYYLKSYSITDLGSLGGDDSRALGINDEGQVVGTSHTSAGYYHAFLWTKGQMMDLGVLGGYMSVANGINNRGDVVGQTDNYEGSGAFLWRDGQLSSVSGSAPGSTAAAINNKCQIVGTSGSISGYFHAALWSDGFTTDLGTLGGDTSVASAVNNRGQVVGNADLIPGSHQQAHAFLWENGMITDLGTLGSSLSFAMGINDRGEVVGQTQAPNDFDYLAFLWYAGHMISLGTLDGGTRSTAYGINNKGQIVGYSYAGDGSTHACLWQHGRITDLNTSIPADSGWFLTNASAINGRGQIVGEGTLNGQTRAFLLTPSNEHGQERDDKRSADRW